MAWTAPRTWVANEAVTSAYMNTYVRDNLAHLITGIRTNAASYVGAPLTQYKSFGYSVGQKNGAGSYAVTPTEMTSFEVMIPGNSLNVGGFILVENLITLGATAEPSRYDIKLGGMTRWQVWAAGSAPNSVDYTRLVIQRLAATTGIIWGVAWLGVAAMTAATGTAFATGIASLDWSTDQALKVYVGGATANNVTMAYHTVQIFPSATGI